MRRGIAALARHDWRQDRKRHHLLQLALEQPEHGGGQKRRGEIDEQPVEPAARDRPDRVRQFFLAANAAERLDVLFRLLLNHVDDVVEGNDADQPVILIDDWRGDEVVALEQARHILLVIGYPN